MCKKSLQRASRRQGVDKSSPILLQQQPQSDDECRISNDQRKRLGMRRRRPRIVSSVPIIQRCVLLLCLFLLFLTHEAMSADSEAAAAAATDSKEGGEEPKQKEDEQCEANEDGTCKVRVITVEELETKTGKDGGKELWLSILGQVYNVSKGPEYYAPGSGYHIFAGRDATVPFVTGNFTAEEAAKHTDELTAAQLYALDREWAQFYAKEKRYHFIGYLCCRFYDAEGKPTEETLRVAERVESYQVIKEARDKERKENRRKMMMAGPMKMTTPADNNKNNAAAKM